MPDRSAPRAGHSLVELLLTLAVVGVVTSVTVPRASSLVDRVSVKGATQDVVLAFASARAAAAERGVNASFVADAASGTVRVVCGGETLFERRLQQSRGVRLEASRESVTFSPSGLGWGAANTTVVVSRGARSDTIVMSRLGRIRESW